MTARKLDRRSFVRAAGAGVIGLGAIPAAGCRAAEAGGARGGFAPVPDAFYEGLDFEMPRVPVPVIPERSVSIVDFGAVGDGRTLATDAFAGASSTARARRGGR
jgi:hypothetical protein